MFAGRNDKDGGDLVVRWKSVCGWWEWIGSQLLCVCVCVSL